MCQPGNETLVKVKIPADLACDGKEKLKEVGIDSCIADLIMALATAGIETRGCCCGHGKRLGHISLQDGRSLIIVNGDPWDLIEDVHIEDVHGVPHVPLRLLPFLT